MTFCNQSKRKITCNPVIYAIDQIGYGLFSLFHTPGKFWLVLLTCVIFAGRFRDHTPGKFRHHTTFYIHGTSFHGTQYDKEFKRCFAKILIS